MTDCRCNICGGQLKPRLEGVVDPQSGDRFGIGVCELCGLGHTLPPPAELATYYGAEYYGNRHGLTDRYCTRRRARFLTAGAGPGRGRRLLDVGCGEGAFLEYAEKRLGWRGTGIELNPDNARKRGLDVLDSFDDATRIGPFDCVTFWHSLEHLRDPSATLGRVREMISDDGSILIAVPDFSGLQAKVFGANWFHLDVPRHLYHFGEKSLTLLLEKTGFEVEHRWNCELEYDLFGWSQSALNTCMPVPNEFFYHLTGRSNGLSAARTALNYALGSLLTVPAFLLTSITSGLGKGGTLVVAARVRPKNVQP